ncbi:DUF371 domain-containing protein [Archaeoglobus veneficus]|nr:DUF371 domain-containing protein [Archaeoglobus veneficus]
MTGGTYAMPREVIIAWGHPNITAKHPTTLEITKDEHLTPRGDCIIGVRASKAISDLPQEIKGCLCGGKKAMIVLYLPDYGMREVVTGFGSPRLTFTHPTDIVVRKSDYVCGRTLIIKADKAAADLSREMVRLLKDPSTELHFIIEV